MIVMNRIMLLMASLTLTLHVQRANAQEDALNAIEKISRAYQSEHTLSFTANMKMYNRANPAAIIEQMQCSYLLHRALFNCRIGPVEMLLNDSFYVSVDRSVKMIIIGHKKDLSGTEQMPALNTTVFKQWIGNKAVEAKLLKRGSLHILTIADQHGIGPYNFYAISFDPVTGYMKTVQLELSDKADSTHKTMVLSIQYSTPTVVVPSREEFSEKRFFSMVNKKIYLNSQYKNFQLINQL